jgi:hypothetical protein
MLGFSQAADAPYRLRREGTAGQARFRLAPYNKKEPSQVVLILRNQEESYNRRKQEIFCSQTGIVDRRRLGRPALMFAG